MSDASRPTETGHVSCPHCHSPILLPEGRTGEAVCPGCGSSIRLQDERLGATTLAVRFLGRFQAWSRWGRGRSGSSGGPATPNSTGSWP
jgi:DNA-directed RNA polymerase subunit RPC12/RpoP